MTDGGKGAWNAQSGASSENFMHSLSGIGDLVDVLFLA